MPISKSLCFYRCYFYRLNKELKSEKIEKELESDRPKVSLVLLKSMLCLNIAYIQTLQAVN